MDEITPFFSFILIQPALQLHNPGKRQALLTVVRGECTDEDTTPISFYPLLPSLDLQTLCSQSLPRKGYQFTSQALRRLTRVLISLPLVKISSFLFVFQFSFFIVCTFQLLAVLVYLHVDGNLYITVMALVGFSASAVQALTYQNGDYMGSLNKMASGAQSFIMALGLFWDIVTGLP